jgi:hypothetical protein
MRVRRVGARGGAGRRVGARVHVAGERAVLDSADFGGNGQILMRSIQ